MCYIVYRTGLEQKPLFLLCESGYNASMTAAKHWVENWNRVGAILEKIEAEELRSPEYEKGLGDFVPMLDWCCQHSEPKNESGLVEQQRLFMAMRNRTMRKDNDE
jgi:hypothetical protein